MNNYSPPITRLKARTNPKLRARLQSSLSLSCKDESSSTEITYFKNNETTPVCLDVDEDKGKRVKGGGGVGPEKAAFKRIPSVRTTLNPVTSPVTTMVPPHLPLSSSSSSSCSEISGEAAALPNSPRTSCKRNRKSVAAVELKLSREEVQMKGAPEGAVYQVGCCCCVHLMCHYLRCCCLCITIYTPGWCSRYCWYSTQLMSRKGCPGCRSRLL